jgi:hypothetical protein
MQHEQLHAGGGGGPRGPQEHLAPKTKKALRLGGKKRKIDSAIPEELPEHWLRSHSDALKIGAERVLLFEGKWLSNMDVEEVKFQIVSYACAIGVRPPPPRR